jgi:small subunit ribosomal protein S13
VWFAKIHGINNDRAESSGLHSPQRIKPPDGPGCLDMPRLLGVDIPGDKRIEASLPYIYGIGQKTAKKILEQANMDPNVRAKNLSPEQLGEIVHAINASGLLIEGDLRREIQGNLKRLQAIRSYRGIRHIRGLPVRGQRTSTNARTRKGPRKTVGVQRNKDAKAGKV